MAEDVTGEDERELLAAELALGLLEGPERAEAQRLRLSDSSFAIAVDDWAERLAPLGLAVPGSAVPTTLWPAIERRLDGVTVANDDAPAAAAPADLMARLRRWQASTAMTGAVAAALALALVVRPDPVAPPAPQIATAPPAQPAQVAVAQLSAPDGAPLLAASYNAETGELRIRAIKLPEGQKVPELWIIPSDGTPRSLGYIRADGTSTVALARPVRGFVDEQPVLAVTLENRDSEPHAAPTGDILASGKVLTI